MFLFYEWAYVYVVHYSLCAMYVRQINFSPVLINRFLFSSKLLLFISDFSINHIMTFFFEKKIVFNRKSTWMIHISCSCPYFILTNVCVYLICIYAIALTYFLGLFLCWFLLRKAIQPLAWFLIFININDDVSLCMCTCMNT